MITYTWEILAKPTASKVKDYQDVVVALVWKLTAQLEDKTAESLNTSFFHSPSDNFIPYKDLTDDVLISWIESKEDMTSIYAELESRLNK
jgi:hypothetical protein